MLRSLAQCGKPFAMLLPISVLHVGVESGIRTLSVVFDIKGMGLLYNGWLDDVGWFNEKLRNRNMTEHCVGFRSVLACWQWNYVIQLLSQRGGFVREIIDMQQVQA